VNNMSKHSYCPFCGQKIPKITETKTVERRKKHHVRIKKITIVIGEDWANHAKTCTKLKEFLNKTKEEL